MYKGDGEGQRARTTVLTVIKQAGQASLLRRRHKLFHPKKKEIDPFSRENTEVMPII
jgi:hypothetical protein